MTTSDDGNDPMLERVVEQLRRPTALDPWLDQRIMRAVRAAPPSPWWERALAWFRDPIRLRVSPLAMTAVAMAAVVLAVGLREAEAPAATAVAPTAATPAGTHGGVRSVQFVLVLPSAQSVAVVGDFNDWQAEATPLHRVGNGGLWTVEMTLPPGNHRYAFIVDGHVWMPDPNAPLTTDDDFGKPNSVVVVEGAA